VRFRAFLCFLYVLERFKVFLCVFVRFEWHVLAEKHENATEIKYFKRFVVQNKMNLLQNVALTHIKH